MFWWEYAIAHLAPVRPGHWVAKKQVRLLNDDGEVVQAGDFDLYKRCMLRVVQDLAKQIYCRL